MPEEENKERRITYAFLMEIFFKQLMAFSESINDTEGNVDTWKYADYVLHCMGKRLAHEFPDARYPDGRSLGENEPRESD